jgi:predicted TIM-barrel fold metal-dependent hydrolase
VTDRADGIAPRTDEDLAGFCHELGLPGLVDVHELLPRLLDQGDRVVLGSDYPNIPYPYAHQVAVLARLGLGDDWLRAVLHHNGTRLLGLRRQEAQ